MFDNFLITIFLRLISLISSLIRDSVLLGPERLSHNLDFVIRSARAIETQNEDILVW